MAVNADNLLCKRFPISNSRYNGLKINNLSVKVMTF